MLSSAEIWGQTWYDIFVELQNAQIVPLIHLNMYNSRNKHFIYIIYCLKNFSDFHLLLVGKNVTFKRPLEKKYLPGKKQFQMVHHDLSKVFIQIFLISANQFGLEKKLIFVKKTNCSKLLPQIKHLRTIFLWSYLDWRNYSIDAHLITHGII